MKKPNMIDYGYVENSGFDSEPSGFVIEGGEDAYYEALEKWKTIMSNIEKAEKYADSKERRGCSYWKGLYDGYLDALNIKN